MENLCRLNLEAELVLTALAPMFIDCRTNDDPSNVFGGDQLIQSQFRAFLWIKA